MHVAEYPYQLDGLGKLKLKKIVKKVAKVAKKVVKPVLHVGAAIVTGGASIPVSAQLIAQSKQRKAVQAQQAREQAATEAMVREIQSAAIAPLPMIAPPVRRITPMVRMIAPAAAPLVPVTTIAPTAAAVSRAQLPPGYAPPPAARYDEERVYAEPEPSRAPAAMPPWLIPVGIGGAVLLAVTMMGRGRGQ